MADTRWLPEEIFPSLKAQTDMVDSMSPPHAAEYILTQHALAQDCRTLKLIDKDIEECQMRIARAHDQMHLLERQHSVIRHRVSIHRARLSPLRYIPDQVLQEIFQHCLPESDQDIYVIPNARSAPLVLTHVCRRWRAVAHGTSELWASITLRDRGVWNYELEVEMVKQWLDRSYMRPIRMRITCPPSSDVGLDGNPFRSDIFHLAIAHSSHLSDLCLIVNKTYLHYFVSHANLPTLRSVTVITPCPAEHIGESIGPTIPVFISAPNLNHASFVGDGASINLIPRTLFPQITSLEFDCDLTLDLPLLFQDFPNLRDLTLTLSLSRGALRLPLPQDHRMIFGPSLLHLEVCLGGDMVDFGDPTMLDTLLDQLELPALQTLTIVAPLSARSHAQTRAGYTQETNWENYMTWVQSPSMFALLSHSQYPQPRIEYRDECLPR